MEKKTVEMGRGVVVWVGGWVVCGVGGGGGGGGGGEGFIASLTDQNMWLRIYPTVLD